MCYTIFSESVVFLGTGCSQSPLVALISVWRYSTGPRLLLSRRNSTCSSGLTTIAITRIISSASTQMVSFLLMLMLAVTLRCLIENKYQQASFSVNILCKRTSNVNSCVCLEKHPVPTPAGNITTHTGKQIHKCHLVCLLLFFLTQ